MRYLGIIIIICSFPFFFHMLRMGANWRRVSFVALGALPLLSSGLNVDAAFVDWASWPGHTKGLIVSLGDTLAVAICVRYSKNAKKPAFFWIWLFYLACSLPGLFVGELFQPALFFTFSLIKSIIYFYACYLVFLRNGFNDFINGLAIALLANGVFQISNSLEGQALAGGLFGHRNFAGMICNMALPALLVARSRGRLWALPILAIVVSAIAAAVGGSRAVILLLGVTIYATLLAAIWVKPSKRAKGMLAICLLASLAVVPIAFQTLGDRFENSGGEFNLAKDTEREAFEQAARMINEDFPWGVGSNQFVTVAIAKGYYSSAGVAWSTIGASAIVHNSYVLVRTEGGVVALIGMLVLLSSTFLFAGIYLLRRRANPARILAVPVLVTVSVFATHIQYEWVFVTLQALYSFAYTTALVAYVGEAARQARLKARTARRLASRPSLPPSGYLLT